MESEKVKDIKKALEHCVSLKNRCRDCYYGGIGCYKLLRDILTLINELESENAELKKYKLDWLNSEKMHLQADMEDTEFELYCANKAFKKVREENQQFKDRINELERENARLANRITCQVTIPDDKLEEIKKECLERVEIAKEKLLKQFAERLKEKLENCSGCYIPDCFESPTNEFAYSAIEVSNAIDETLEESLRNDCSTL